MEKNGTFNTIFKIVVVVALVIFAGIGILDTWKNNSFSNVTQEAMQHNANKIISIDDYKSKNKDNTQDQMHNLTLRLDGFARQFVDFKADTNNQYQMLISLTNNSTSIIANILVITSIVLAVIAVLFGLYINNKNDEIKQTLNEVKNRETEIKDFLENNRTNLYKKLMEEDTKNMLIKLNNEPLNIQNVFGILAVRDVLGEESILVI